MWTETTLVVAAAAPAETKMALVAVEVAVVPAKKTTPLSVAAPKRRPRVAASNELCIELVTLFDSLCLSGRFPPVCPPMLPFLFSALREYQHHRHRPSQLPLIPNWLESSSSKQPAYHRHHRRQKASAPKYVPRSFCILARASLAATLVLVVVLKICPLSGNLSVLFPDFVCACRFLLQQVVNLAVAAALQVWITLWPDWRVGRKNR